MALVDVFFFLTCGRDEETCIALRCVRYDFDKATWARDWKGVFERTVCLCMEMIVSCAVDRMWVTLHSDDGGGKERKEEKIAIKNINICCIPYLFWCFVVY